jgi:hypothetical protein
MLNRNWAKKIKTDKDRLNTMIEWLTENHLDSLGGYPHDWKWIGNTLVVADLDDRKERNATLLVTYQKIELLRWCKRAEKFMSERIDDMPFEDCLFETATRRAHLI